MVPYSSNLHSVAVEGKEKVHKGPHIRLKIPLNDFGGRAHIVTFSAESAPKAEQSNKPFANELLVPFWLVRSTGDKDRANMHRSKMKSFLAVSLGKGQTNGEPVFIPILQNSKPVKRGDELLIYDEPTLTIEPQVPASAPKRPQEEAAESAPKRPREEAVESTLQGDLQGGTA